MQINSLVTFVNAYKANNVHNAESLYRQYSELRVNYFGVPITEYQAIDTELRIFIAVKRPTLQS